jgi:hypothetical protein
VRADAELRVSQFGYSIDLCGRVSSSCYIIYYFPQKNQTEIFILLGKKNEMPKWYAPP